MCGNEVAIITDKEDIICGLIATYVLSIVQAILKKLIMDILMNDF